MSIQFQYICIASQYRYVNYEINYVKLYIYPGNRIEPESICVTQKVQYQWSGDSLMVHTSSHVVQCP